MLMRSPKGGKWQGVCKMTIKNEMILLGTDKIPELGGDVSYYQGDIDFRIMRASGIRAVIIRAGYGTTIDKRFITYINAAIKAGIAIGIYWFIYAKDAAGIKNNADKCLQIIEPYRQFITLGVWADWEYDSDKWAGSLSAAARSGLVDNFNCLIGDAGYEAGIYSNQDYIQSGKFQPWLVSKYPLWFAKYSANISSYAYKGKNSRPYMWQYSSMGDGKTHGTSSKYLDTNKVFIDFMPDTAIPPTDIVTQNPDAIQSMDNPYPEPTRTIYYTPVRTIMYGDDVKWVQWHMWRFGLFLDGAGNPDATQIDGRWGAKSDKALGIAQEILKLLPDKKCGPKSRQVFKQV